MIICCSNNFSPKMKTVVALGSFDGLHLGHIKVIERAVAIGLAHGLMPTVYIVERSANKILSNIKRLKILHNLGVRAVVIDQLALDLIGVSCEDFVSSFICGTFQANYVCIGENYQFGPSGASNARDLEELCANRSVKVEIVPLFQVDGLTVSSSLIRELLASGKTEEAEKFLIGKISNS